MVQYKLTLLLLSALTILSSVKTQEATCKPLQKGEPSAHKLGKSYTLLQKPGYPTAFVPTLAQFESNDGRFRVDLSEKLTAYINTDGSHYRYIFDIKMKNRTMRRIPLFGDMPNMCLEYGKDILKVDDVESIVVTRTH